MTNLACVIHNERLKQESLVYDLEIGAGDLFDSVRNFGCDVIFLVIDSHQRKAYVRP